MAVSKSAFGGFQMAWRELRDHGLDPFSDLSRLEFAGFPQDRIVMAVRNGQVDAGTVRTDVIERMAQAGRVKVKDFRILGPHASPGFPFVHSTRLYPEWPFAKLSSTPDRLAEQVVVALLALPENSPAALASRSAGWTIPLDYSPVHQLLRDLRLGPYRELGRVSIAALVREYGAWLAAGAVAFLLLASLTSYVINMNRRLAQSRLELQREVDERAAAQTALARHREELEQRVRDRTRELERVNRDLTEDIQARLRAEKALRSSERALRQLHDATNRRGASLREHLNTMLRIGCEYFQLRAGLFVDIRGAEPVVLCRFGDPLLLSPPANFLRATVASSEPQVVLDGVGLAPGTNTAFAAAARGAKDFFGVLVFLDADQRSGPFTSVDVDILQLMTQWIGGESERLRAEEQARQHQSELAHVARLSTMGEMASGLAHELNQPLTAVMNYTRGVLRRLSASEVDPALVDAMGRATAEAERAAQIIRRLREFVRKREPRAEVVDLNDTVRGVAHIAAPEAERNDVRVQLELEDELPPVLGDRIQLEQVLLNLTRNAVEAMAGGDTRSLLIRSSQRGERVRVEVLDSGRGVPDEDRERLFDPFFSTKPEGMGMGLSISRSIIEAHGGTLAVELTPDSGSRFYFDLPAHGEARQGVA
jgi:C4-dicarboxylate-specific signal transduction histidine kinase